MGNKNNEHYLVMNFYINNVKACVKLNDINKVILLAALEQVPGAPDYIAGILDVAGKTILVVDLAICIGLNRTTRYSLETPIILCEHNNHLIGFIVDKIVGVDKVSSENLQMTTEFNNTDSFYLGAISQNGILSVLMDIDKLFSEVLSFTVTQRTANPLT